MNLHGNSTCDVIGKASPVVTQKAPESIESKGLDQLAQTTRTASDQHRHGSKMLDHIKSAWDRIVSTEKPTQAQWKTTWKRYGPLLGLSCIGLAFGSIFASLAILLVSDNEPATWEYQPATYLAIFTAVANQSMRFASLQGVAIAWWSRAMHVEGISVSDLHHNWDMGTNIWSALIAGKRTNLLAIACIISTFVAIDGPLLQQSSKIVSTSIPSNDRTAVSLVIEIPAELVANYTGYFNASLLPGWMLYWYTPQSGPFSVGPWRDFLMNTTVNAQVSGCSGACKASIRAPALSIKECNYVYQNVNYSSKSTNLWPVNGADMWMTNVFPGVEGSDMYNLAFYTNVGWIVAEKEYLNLTALSDSIHNDLDCAGTTNYTSCLLESAIAEYDVIVTNATAASDPAKFENFTIELPVSMAYPKIVDIANNTRSASSIDYSDWYSDSTLAGLAPGSFTVSIRRSVAESGEVNNIQDSIFGVNQALYIEHLNPPVVTEGCVEMTDAFEDILDSLNRIMFRGAIGSVQYFTNQNLSELLDPGQQVQQTVQGHLTGTWNVYETDLSWFYGAAAVEVLCILLILPTYWSWWRLGRAVSFSPLEIAKAFDAPLLANCNSNLAAEDLAKATQNRLTRYGATGEINGDNMRAERLVFAQKEHVYRPLNTFEFEH